MVLMVRLAFNNPVSFTLTLGWRGKPRVNRAGSLSAWCYWLSWWPALGLVKPDCKILRMLNLLRSTGVRTRCAPHSGCSIWLSDLHRIQELTSVEPEEWGAGWQVRRHAGGDAWILHTRWQLNGSILSGIEAKPQTGMCNHNIPC